uniref:B30.2/SPRY domain-containing protein n=1 Tax=Globodera rostochiensis TaxID=31243 RepID=A0A914HNE5_GLORO
MLNKFEEIDIVELRRALNEYGLTPQNRWNAAARHDQLTLAEPGRLCVQNSEQFGHHSVVAEQPIPQNSYGFAYYEVKVVGGAKNLCIGLATNQMPLDACVGRYDGTYAYASNGTFWGHAVAGCSRWNGRPYIEAHRRYPSIFDGMPPFHAGDVIGCGVDLATRQIIYTKNGRRLETTGLLVSSDADLFPCVTQSSPGTGIEANFGPNFVHKF